jgi:S-methylmethionine-dependent homocysteine/selenocysteine methylase
MSPDFLPLLASGRPLLLDSAMGTELERRGMELELPLWSARALLEKPDLVIQIHRDNVAAGADILTANTFRTQRGALVAAGLGDRAAELTRLAVSLARRAASESGREVFVAGSVAPLADCYRPELVADRETLEREHTAHLENLLGAGVDLVLVETMNTVREAQAAVNAARGRVPAIVSFVTNGEGSLLSGERIERAVQAVLPLSPAAVGVNCVSLRSIGNEVERLVEETPDRAVAAYANNLSDDAAPEEYSRRAAEWIRRGVRIVGGCCGTTPDHTAALRRVLDRMAREG